MKIENGDMTLLFLSSLPISCEHFKDTLLYGKEITITLDEVHKNVRSKELSKLKDLKFNDRGECLSVSKAMSESKGNQKGKRSKLKSKSKVSNKSKFKYFTCQKTSHSRRIVLKGGTMVIMFRL